MSGMYDVVPWLDKLNALSVLTVVIVIVGFITVGRGVWWMLTNRAFQALATNELNVTNLSHELRTTVSRWHKLGIELGIELHELNKIEEQYSSNAERRMAETLNLWLRCKPSASWKDVVKALQEMEENTLAERIQNKYIGRADHPIQEGSGAVAMARQNLQEIKWRFSVLHKNACKKLREKQINVTDFRACLTSLFPEESIPNSSNIQVILEAITHEEKWNYWNYFLLEKVVQEFLGDDQEMMSLIQTYKKDLVAYKATTKFVDYLVLRDHQQTHYECDKRYGELTVQLETMFTDHTLEYIEYLWKEFAVLYNLPPCVPLLQCIRKGSVSIVWLIPSQLAYIIHNTAPSNFDFYRKYQITRVELDGECIYCQEVEEHAEESETVPQKETLASKTPGPEVGAQIGHPWEKSSMESTIQPRLTLQKSSPASTLGEGVQTGHPCQKEKFGGYDTKFINPPASAFQTECPICHMILRDPYLVTCCGTSFCQTCIQRVQADRTACPICRKDRFDTILNKGLLRSLNQLHVYCSQSGGGCDWRGELGELDKHLNENSPEGFRLVGCRFTEIQCEFGYAGCKVQLSREDMAAHMSEQQDHHIKLLSGKLNEQNLIQKLVKSLQSKDEVITNQNVLLQRKHVKNLTPQIQESMVTSKAHGQLIPINHNFTMVNFEYHKKNNTEWYSNPFYTHHQGYKMCVRIDANGYDTARGTHVSLYTCFMQGDYDDELTWPFCGKIAIDLLNQNADDHHHEYIVYYNDSVPDYDEYAQRVKIGKRSRGWGNDHFISHETLKKSDPKVQYLKSNCLEFRVREVLLDTRHPRTRLSIMQCVIL